MKQTYLFLSIKTSRGYHKKYLKLGMIDASIEELGNATQNCGIP